MNNAELKTALLSGAPVKVWDTAFGVVSVVECKTCQTRFVFPWHRKGKELFDFWNRRASREVHLQTRIFR